MSLLVLFLSGPLSSPAAAEAVRRSRGGRTRMLSRDDLRSMVGEDGRDADGDQVDLVSMESRRSKEEVAVVVAAPAQQVEEEDSQAQQSARYAYIKNFLCFWFFKGISDFFNYPLGLPAGSA